jgi:hypothetical protein
VSRDFPRRLANRLVFTLYRLGGAFDRGENYARSDEIDVLGDFIG